MKLAKHVFAPATALLIGLTATLAVADETGAQGRVVRFSLNTQGSDDAGSMGSIGVKKSDGKTEEYRWGGTSCPASKLTDGQVLALEHAFHNRHRTLVTPRFKPGDVKEIRCLVGFEFTATS